MVFRQREGAFMSAAGVIEHRPGRLLLLCGVMVLVAMVGCESDTDGPISPAEQISPAASPATAVLSYFFVSRSEIVAGEMDTLIASVVDLKGNPFQGAVVDFATSLGSFRSGRQTAADSSDAGGIAYVPLITTVSDSGQAVVEAYLNGITRRASITIQPSPTEGPPPVDVDEITVGASPQVVLADDGQSFSTVIARATTDEGVAVPGVFVEFTTTAGFIVSPVQTDSRGEATTSLYSPATASTAIVKASVGGVEATTTVQFVAPSTSYILEASAAPDVIRADGGESFSVISARLLDENRHPVEGASVSFETDRGFISKSATTDVEGLAVANLHSDSEAGVATVTVSFGDEIETIQVVFSPTKEPTPFKVNLFATPMTIPADGGSSTSLVVATVLNSSNNPLEGVTVEFETTLGMIAGSGLTNAMGQVSVVLYSDQDAGTATVTAIVGSFSKTINVTMVSVTDYYSVEMRAAPTAIFADGGNSTSEINATLTTSDGNPIEGALLHFTTSAGRISESAQTDSLGTATALLRSDSKAGTATVRAAFLTTVYGEIAVEMLPLDAPVFTIEVHSSRPQVQVKGTGGIETADIIAMAYDVLGNPSPDGTDVTFTIKEAPGTDESLASAGFGPVTISTVDGLASVPFRSGTSSGTVVIGASAGGLVSDITPVTVHAGPPAKINLCVGELNVSYCRHEPNDVCGYVCDAYNNPVASGIAVFLTVDKGCVTGAAETAGEVFTDDNGNGQWDVGELFEDTIDNGVYDPQGVIKALWTDCGPGPFGIVTITAETSGGSITGTIDFIASGCPAAVTFISASPNAILADGESTSLLRFQVLDENGLFVKEGTPVFFNTDWGTIVPDTSFTRDGIHESVALATLISQNLTQDYSMPSSTTGDGVGTIATVSAEANFESDQGTVTFLTAPSDINKSTLEAPTPMGLSARAIFTAAMKDFHENPLGAHEIEFVCSDGLFNNGLNTISSFTGATGVANAVYFAPGDTNTVVISIRDLDARGGNLGLNRVITVR